jgi:DNA-binding LytR/AlgR family response regulator
MNYTFSVIDSDATSNLQLQTHLQDYGDFQCADMAHNPIDGLNKILKHVPDVVFVHLNNFAWDNLNMISELHQFMPQLPTLIGYSKSKEYAYEAIKYGFFDYWLLPHNEYDIRKTILRLRKYIPKENVPTTICLKSYRDYHYVNTGDILYLKAHSNATDIFMQDGSTINTYRTLKSFEEQLPENFIRIHQSYILNSHYVSRINYGKSTCTLGDENQLPFSKTYKQKVDALKQILSKSSIRTSF